LSAARLRARILPKRSASVFTAVDAGDAWTAAVAEEYRRATAAGRTPHPLVQLAALIDPTAVTPALFLVVTPDDREGDGAAVHLLEHPRGAGLCGAAGTGKTTTTDQMAKHAAGAGRTAIVVSADAYRRGDLDRRVRRVLDAAVGRPLARSAVDAALTEEHAVLLVDGLGGLTPE
jgi:hypothetical protein